MSNRKMSKYVTEQMFIYSQTATLKHIPNNFKTLGQFNIACYLCQKVADPIIDYYPSKKGICESGFRGKELNKAVNGSDTSDHCINNISIGGAAIDLNIIGVDPKQLFNDVFTGKIKQPNGKPLRDIIDQMIYEERHTPQGVQRWVHFGHRNIARKQFMMSLDGKTYRTVTNKL